MGKVLDLDVFVPDTREIKLGGKVFDLTYVPFEISLQVYALEEVIQKIAASNRVDAEGYEKIFQIIYKMLKLSDADLDEAWLRKQITAKRFPQLMPFILSALFDEPDDGKKNDDQTVLPLA